MAAGSSSAVAIGEGNSNLPAQDVLSRIRVELQGLVEIEELNGAVGRLVSPDPNDKERFIMNLEVDSNSSKVSSHIRDEYLIRHNHLEKIAS